MKKLLIREGRLRSGWRVVSYIVVSRLILLIFVFVLLLILTFWVSRQGMPATDITLKLTEILTTLPGLGAAEIIQLAITLAVVYIWRRGIDKRSFRSLGVQLAPGWWKQALLGVIFVGLMWIFMFVFAFTSQSFSIEGVRLDGASLLTGLGLGLALNVLVGLNEEIDARGYVLQNLAEGMGFSPAVIVSALYFGLLHLLNPGASLLSIMGVALFGVLAALAYWATGELWMSIGMHAAWNFFEGPVFGFSVSGLNLGGLFVLKDNGPEWVTGGRFGPEAGIVTIVPLLIMIGAVYLWGNSRRAALGVSSDLVGKPENTDLPTS